MRQRTIKTWTANFFIWRCKLIYCDREYVSGRPGFRWISPLASRSSFTATVYQLIDPSKDSCNCFFTAFVMIENESDWLWIDLRIAPRIISYFDCSIQTPFFPWGWHVRILLFSSNPRSIIEKIKSPPHPQCYKDKKCNSKYTKAMRNIIGGFSNDTMYNPDCYIRPG